MIALEAFRLGFQARVYSDKAYSHPASLTHASYSDEVALQRFAEACDVITFEFENIPPETLRFVSKYCPTFPSITSLEASAHRIHEKKLFERCSVPTNRYRKLSSEQELLNFLSEGKAAVVKQATGGYDGKGQWLAEKGSIPSLDYNQELIVEEKIELQSEISTLVCRARSGKDCALGPFENHHVNHILRRSFYPAEVSEDTLQSAITYASRIAAELQHVGVLCVEFFIDHNGHLLANEIAPRVHNSAHLTLDAASHSQFELHLRAILDLELPSATEIRPSGMLNILGSCKEALCYSLPGRVHLYGKNEWRPNRKCGHLTLQGKDARETIAHAERKLYPNDKD